MSRRLACLVALCLVLCFVQAQDNSTDDDSFDDDPILQYRPQFARSLPVQILLTGVVFTLVAVLFIHLVFTAQYHWPLAQVNYVLQLSGVSTLLISLIATLHVVLQASLEESKNWPYMLSYIAVNVPPLGSDDNGWSGAERALWLLMNATTSALIQITHIQFLTLLYPSRLEARLIFFLLAPLALVSAVMQLLPIHPNPKVNFLASAIKNVCNATLSLLFTASLFIWGLLVNRRQAWRTDGGTAAFGAAALVLALVSTALNFLYVPREEEYVWLPGLMWAVVLWQSFLGWWWWVGAGSGGWLTEDEMEEKARRAEKRERKKEKKKEKRLKAAQSSKNVTGISRRKTSAGATEPDTVTDDSNPDSMTDTSSVTTFTMSTTRTLQAFSRFFPDFLCRWCNHLRQAHLMAARAQAADRTRRMREGAPRVDGWGLGNYEWGMKSGDVPMQDTQDECLERHRDGDHEGKTRGSAGGKARPRGLWWWGPLGKWRLHDSTVY